MCLRQWGTPLALRETLRDKTSLFAERRGEDDREHYHKAEYLFYRNVHALQTGCFQSQTPFTRGKGISVHIGGWIVTIKVDEYGTIQRITPEFIPFYKSIKDDYKNYI